MLGRLERSVNRNINIFGFCDLSFVSGHLTHLAESELVSANERLHFFLNLFSSKFQMENAEAEFSALCSPQGMWMLCL